MPKPELFAAQVVLAGAPDDPALATAEQIQSLRPDPSAARDVQRAFEAKGFKTGPVVGFSFSIEGSADLFRQAFGVDPMQAPDGTVRDRSRKARRLELLPLDRLLPALRTRVKRVLFSSPPAFGPGNP
jgi:hypothetical protein